MYVCILYACMHVYNKLGAELLINITVFRTFLEAVLYLYYIFITYRKVKMTKQQKSKHEQK